MKTIVVEVAREQAVEAYFSVPDHWDINRIRREVTRKPVVLEEAVKKLDEFDWKNDYPHYHINSISMKPVDEPPDLIG